jgi:hypothetical protein
MPSSVIGRLISGSWTSARAALTRSSREVLMMPTSLGRVSQSLGGACAAQAARWRRCRRSKGAQPVFAPAPCHRTARTTLASTRDWETRPRCRPASGQTRRVPVRSRE